MNDEKYQECLNKYAQEFFEDTDRYDYLVYSMDDFDEMNKDLSPIDLVLSVINGYQYNSIVYERNESFNPNDKYFAYNGYGNLISIPQYELTDYYDSYVEKNKFIEWLEEHGYIEDDE